MKKVTLQDIADELGISRNTVSKAINNSEGIAPSTRDKILQKDASNYPSAVRLNSDHTGVFKGSPDVEIIWHARDGIIREAAPDGASYEYRLDDDTLYLMMDGEQVEFNREDTEEAQ